MGNTKFRDDLFNTRCGWLAKGQQTATKELQKHREVREKVKEAVRTFSLDSEDDDARICCWRMPTSPTLMMVVPFDKGGARTEGHGKQEDFQDQQEEQPPPVAAKRLKPFIDRGIANGIFADDSSVVAMFKAKATDASLKETLIRSAA